MTEQQAEILFDHSLRMLTVFCYLAALWLIWTVAPLFAPRPSMSEALLMEHCIAVKGSPVIDMWGNYSRCER